MLLHNDVRWLSKGKALERFCALVKEVQAFLQLSNNSAASNHLAHLDDKKFLSNVAFLADVFGHLNMLSLQLQGRGRTIVDMVEKLQSFTWKLELLESDVSTGRLLHFATLKTLLLGQVTDLIAEFIQQLRANFTSRFEDYSVPKEIIPSLNQAAFEMEFIDFQTSSLVGDALRSAGSVSAFWVSCSEVYCAIKRLAI